jgi:hypothetical protein
MLYMKQSLGKLERKLFAYTQLRCLTELYTGNLVNAWYYAESGEKAVRQAHSRAQDCKSPPRLVSRG